MKSPLSRPIALLLPCVLFSLALKPAPKPTKATGVAALLQSKPVLLTATYTHIPKEFWKDAIENIIASHNGVGPDKIIPANASIVNADTLVWGKGANAQYFIQDKQMQLLKSTRLELFTSYRNEKEFKEAYSKLVKTAAANGYKIKDSLREFTVGDSVHPPYTIMVGSVYKVIRPKSVKGRAYVAESEIVFGVIHNPNY